MSCVLAFDVGKSRCRAALFIDGSLVDSSEEPGPSGLADVNGPTAAVAAMATASAKFGPDAVDTVAAGLAGLAGLTPPAAKELTALLAQQHKTHKVVLASDMTTSHLGALGGAPGVVVAGGTGAVALAVSASGRTSRVDGWGYILGDAGSGYDIGRHGLAAAMRTHDGRGSAEALRVLAEHRFGDLDDLPRVVHGANNLPRTIAAFALDVLKAAEDGDQWALSIWSEAGAELARTTATAARLLPETSPIVISTVGGLFDAGPILTNAFARELQRLLPSGQVQPSQGNALDGAHLMATRQDLPHDTLLIRNESESR